MPFLVLCVLLWGGYLLRRVLREPGVLRTWGIRRDNLAPAALRGLPVFALMALLVAGYRFAAGWRPLPATSAWVFALYPVWGFLQQFLAHAPDWPLAAMCAGAGLLWTPLYLRERNLFPLAFGHAWLGALVYYWILERDPWREFFGGPG